MIIPIMAHNRTQNIVIYIYDNSYYGLYEPNGCDRSTGPDLLLFYSLHHSIEPKLSWSRLDPQP